MDEKVPKSNIIETEIPMGTVHPAALEPYRVRIFVEDEIVQEAEITIGVNHRGIERIMEGLPIEKANALKDGAAVGEEGCGRDHTPIKLVIRSNC